MDRLPAVVFTTGVPPAMRWRYGSPSIGSILMTSAPRSASITPAVGPAMIVANSTTVMPSSGRPGGGAVPDGATSSRGTQPASTDEVCSPTCGAGRPTAPGVDVNSAIGPTVRTAPTTGSS